MQTFTKPGRPASQYQYESDGRLKRAEDPAGGFQTITRGALATGHEVTRSTALGRATKYTVDNRPTGEQKLTTREPDGTQAVTELFEDGRQRVALPDATTVGTISAPDPRFGMQTPYVSTSITVLPSSLTRTDGGTRSVVLADPKNVLSVTTLVDTATVNGRTTTATYTAATRTEVVTTPVGRTSTTVYDALGRVTSEQAGGLAPVGYAYDSRGRLTTMTHGSGPGSRTFAFAYGAQGFLQSVTDPLGRTVQFVRDANGRATSKTLPDGSLVLFGYDAAGDLVSVTPPGRPAHVFSYDGRGRTTTVAAPGVLGSGPSTFAYNADGQMTQVSRAGGEAISATFDAAGRPNGVALTNVGLPTSTYTLGYDSVGRVATRGGPGGQSVGFTYDGSLVTGVSWAGPVAASVTRTLDNDLRVASESVNGGAAVAYTYNPDGLLTQAGGYVLGRNPQSGLIQSSTLGVVTDSVTRNGFAEPTAYSVLANGAPVFGETYVRNAVGQITQRQETIGGVADTIAYAYDTMGQLVSVTRDGTVVESYSYDANGNRLTATLSGATRSATYDAQDRLLTDGAATFGYAPAGRLATKTVGASTTTYRYDAQGNLLQVVLPAGTTIDYQVDALGGRVGKSVNGTPTKRFVTLGLRTLAELDDAGTVVSRFVYAGGAAPAYMVKAGQTYRLVTDHVGSVRLVVDVATGAVAQRIDYDAFGNVTADTNPDFQPFGFAGGLHDPDTGLVRFGARDYDPASGRWTAKDPVGFRGGDTNLYRYALNDPVNRVDRDGRIRSQAVIADLQAQLAFAEDILVGLYNRIGMPSTIRVDGIPLEDVEVLVNHPEAYRRELRQIEEARGYARFARRALQALSVVAFGAICWNTEARAEESGRSWGEQFDVDQAAEGRSMLDDFGSLLEPLVDTLRGAFSGLQSGFAGIAR